MLFNMHAMAAHFMGSHYLAITHDEAQKLDVAATNVMSHYDLPEVQPHVMDWILLAQTLGMVYGTRYAAWRTDVASRRARPVAPVAGDPESRPQPGAPSEPPSTAQPRRIFQEGIGWIDEVLPPGATPPTQTRQ